MLCTSHLKGVTSVNHPPTPHLTHLCVYWLTSYQHQMKNELNKHAIRKLNWHLIATSKQSCSIQKQFPIELINTFLASSQVNYILNWLIKAHIDGFCSIRFFIFGELKFLINLVAFVLAHLTWLMDTANGGVQKKCLVKKKFTHTKKSKPQILSNRKCGT